eukprot:snap_masked-scaffold_22-processed-gene-1.8-mRNA-1 protein AED:0.17 eAED:0.21 QI:0/0/0/0.8/1/1/5/0/277
MYVENYFIENSIFKALDRSILLSLQYILPSEIILSTFSAEKQLIQYFNPKITPSTNTPNQNYPLNSLLISGTITILYFILVLFSAYISKKENKQNAGEGKIIFFVKVYNLVQVVLCSYMMGRVIQIFFNEDLNLVPNKFIVERETVANIHWLFYISKLIDFLDTFFIIIRKKWRQLSFLHVYHHGSVFFHQWLHQRAGYDGDIYFSILANSLVHTVIVPIFFKKLVTNIQIIQFIFMQGHGIAMLIFEGEYPKRLKELYKAKEEINLNFNTSFVIKN